MQCTNCGAELQPGATVCPVCERRVVPTQKAVAPPRKRTTRVAKPAPVRAAAGIAEPSAPAPAPAPKPAMPAPAPAAKPATPASAAKPAARPAPRPVPRASRRPAVAASASSTALREFPAAAMRAVGGAFAWVRSKFAKSGRPPWLVPVAVAVAVLVVAGAGWLVFSGVTTGANTPEAAALRMMQAYGNYDAAALLANSTHSSLTPAPQAALVQQYAAAKAAAKGPAIKNIAIAKVTIDPKDPTLATVKVSEQVLDPNTGKYSARTDTLSLVQQNGRWLVRLF